MMLTSRSAGKKRSARRSMTSVSYTHLPEMSGSAGRACTDDDVRVVAVHPDGSHAEPEEVVPHDNETPGEIIIRSPAKSAFCYYNNPEMTAQKFYKGWLYTCLLYTSRCV